MKSDSIVEMFKESTDFSLFFLMWVHKINFLSLNYVNEQLILSFFT